MSNEVFLDTTPERLGFSQDFCERCSAMRLTTLKEILQINPEDLVSRNGFSYHWLGELSDYLTKHGLQSLLQRLPGNTLR